MVSGEVSALKERSITSNGISLVTNTTLNASEWKHNQVQQLKKKKKSNALCSCHKTFKQILCKLVRKSFVSAPVKGLFKLQSSPPKTFLKRRQKETRIFFFATKFLYFISIDIWLLVKMYK